MYFKSSYKTDCKNNNKSEIHKIPNTIDMTDLRTPLERARAERDKKLCRKYAECTQTFVGAKPYRIMRILAEEFGMTPQGIRAALVRNGMMGKKKEVPLSNA